MTKPPSPYTDGGGLSCTMSNCDKSTNSCVYTCVFSGEFIPPPLPPPPPAPHPRATSSQSHMAPFLIAAVCILGISFLLLTTCTIILRRRRTGNSNPNSSINGGDDDGGGDIGFVDHPIWHITTIGLQQSVIDSITAFKYKRIDNFLTEGSDCSVCLTQFEDGDDLRLLPKCSHAFHVNCIDTWLRSHKNCPICRAPVVNEGFTGGNLVARSGRLSSRQEVVIGGLGDEGIHVSGRGESSSGLREGDLCELPMEGIKIAEMLNKNRELRVLSDLGVNYRFKNVNEEDVFEPVKRASSFNALAASAICEAISEGDVGASVQERKIDILDVDKQGTSMSGFWMIKSSSIGPSLQKEPISTKRSLSSGAKLFSFRRTKSQASILPL